MVTFEQCVYACWENEAFMSNYRRLTGAKLGTMDPKTALEAMIDNACGAPVLNEIEVKAFLDFIRDFVFFPVNAMCLRDSDDF